MPLSVEEFRKAGYQAIDRICDLYSNFDQRNAASCVEPGYLRAALPDHPPEQGEDFQAIIDDYDKLIVPGFTYWQHPSFFAYFPTASTFEGMLGDLYSNSVANPGFNWECSPACTELEAIVMDWGAKLFGLDKVFYNESAIGGGVIQTTASDTGLIAVVAARARYTRAHPGINLNTLVIYTTTQTHSLGTKAALVLGLTARALEVSADDAMGLRGATLQKALKEDAEAGLHPFVLIATVGTTSSGAIDNLPEIFEVAKNNPDLWVHIDAAWAGVALACEEYRETCYLAEINQYAASFCTNFHKWGLVNFDCSAMWVRDRTDLTNALDITPEFLKTRHGQEGTVIDYRNWHLSLGRRFRSLKLWFVLRSYGAEGFRAHIRKGIGLNKRFASLVESSKELKLVARPSFALSVFCVRVPEETAESAIVQNELTLKLAQALSARKDITITKTVLNGIYCLRIAVGAERTEERHIDAAFELISSEARQIMASYHKPAAEGRR